MVVVHPDDDFLGCGATILVFELPSTLGQEVMSALLRLDIWCLGLPLSLCSPSP